MCEPEQTSLEEAMADFPGAVVFRPSFWAWDTNTPWALGALLDEDEFRRRFLRRIDN